MEPLFLTPTDSFEKEANIKLERDTKQWPENITAFLHQAYPWITDAKIQVNFNRVDDEEGAGVGQVQLDDKASIPIVIENFKLQPLDVFWAAGKLQPLTKQALLSVLEGTELGRPIAPRKSGAGDMALLSRTQVPCDGRYVYAHQLDLSKDDIFKAAQEAFGYADLATALNTNPIFKEVLTDWMKTAGVSKIAEAKAPSSNAGTHISMTPGEKIQEKKVEDHKEGENHRPKKENLIEKETHHPGVVKKAGVFDLPMGMQKVACIVANHIVSLDGHIKEDQMAAFELSGDRYYYGANFVGYRNKGLEKIAAFGTNRVQGWGAFVLQTADPTETIATEPLKVLFREHTAEGFDKIAVETIAGRRDLFISDDVKNWAEIDGDLHLSSKWTFKPCGKMEKVSGYMPVSPTGAAVLEKFAEWLSQPQEQAPETAGVEPKNLFKEAAAIQPASMWFPLSNAQGTKLTKVAVDVSTNDAKKTVDTLLGLNFITPENSYKFAEQLEKISEAKEACAKLLLASRLGLPLRHAPLKTAMFALDAAELDLAQFNNVVSGSDQH